MKKTGLLLLMLFVLFSVGCSQESEFLNPEEEDFLSWTKEYLDAGEALSAGGSVKQYEKTISDIVGEDLFVERMEAANQIAADVEINGKVYSGQETLELIFGDEAKLIRTSVDLSQVYDDLDSERDFFKYVIVKQRITVFDENDEVITDKVIPKSNSATLRKFWFQKLDDRWVLYSIEKMRFLPDENEEYTRAEFNGEPITFTHYKDFEINLIQ